MLRVGERVVVGPVFERAAQLAFYAVLALAPFLVVLTSIAGFLPSQNTIDQLLSRAQSLMPSEAFDLVSEVMADVVESRSATLLTVGLLTAIWSASRAANALRTALNAAHDLKGDGRSFVRQQVIAILFTLCGAVLLLASVVASVVGAGLIEQVGSSLGFDAFAEARLWGVIRWPMAVGSLVLLAALAYRILPDIRPRASASLWGAAVATVLFLAGSRLFAIYAEKFADFGPTYGALAGGVVLLLWSWLSAIAFIVGGEVTAALPGARPRRDR
ncbi:MAG: YihY/virulence factor BrkB family protein [Archangium sp.]|nr:YihY/virulence factor BrkB family protein [Archangium sp.]